MSNLLSLSSMLGEADIAGWVFMKAVSDDLTELSPESVKLFHDISLKRNDMKMTVVSNNSNIRLSRLSKSKKFLVRFQFFCSIYDFSKTSEKFHM